MDLVPKEIQRFKRLFIFLRFYHKSQGLNYCEFGHSKTRRIILSDLIQYKRDYEILGLTPEADQNEVRNSYLKLAKRFHPDGGYPEANPERFQEVNLAYNNLLAKFADERHNRHKYEGEYELYYEQKRKQKKEEDAPDIKHTAPQHRQYLNFDGVGSGTPSQREKQYHKHRVQKATENLMDHRIKKVAQEGNTEEIALAKDQRAARKIKTRYGIDRLVEDLIQESMSKGEFDNLAGKGKPLDQNKSSFNPYVDFTTHKMNQMLIDNGFKPEWILLEQEIRSMKETLRKRILFERHKYDKSLTHEEKTEWDKTLKEKMQPFCDDLNIMINKYNLLVPTMIKQMVCVELERESKRAIENYSEDVKKIYEEKQAELQKFRASQSSSAVNYQDTFIGLILSMFTK